MNAISATRRRVLFAILFALLVGVRLYLAGDRDIVATNSPYDEYWYVSSALRGIWGGSYDQMAFAHLPVYAGWIAILHVFGIPGRLAIDLAWLAASGYLAYALRHLTGSRWLAVAVFAFLAFHPYTFAIFDRALAETLLAALSAFALAGFIETWNLREGGAGAARRWLSLIATTLGFAAAYHTRIEGMLLLLPLVVVAAISIVRRQGWWQGRGRTMLALPMLVYPLIAVVLAGLLLSLANGVRWGIAARYDLAAPGYVAAVEALNAIDPGTRTPRHVTVTAATRRAAYGASPTFAELRGFFEGPQGRFLERYTQQFTGVAGEIGNGWFYWALRDAAAGAGWHAKGAVAADAKYQAVADELKRAFQEDRLKRRFVPSSFVDPDIAKWIGDLPGATTMALELAIAPSAAPFGSPPENATTGQLESYVRALGRRRMPQSVTVAGWLKAPAGSLIALGDGSRSFAWRELAGDTRPDVPGAFPFRLTSQPDERATQLDLRRADGSVRHLPLADLSRGRMAKFDGAPELIAGIDELSLGSMDHRGNDAFLAALAEGWSWSGYALALAALVGVLLSLRHRDGNRTIATIALLALLECLARSALLGMLDASSWSGARPRYMLPAVPLFVTFAAAGVFLLLRSLPMSVGAAERK